MSLRRVLITGCSGAGKSTLLEAMSARGFEVRREPGRRVIRAETRTGGNGLPWEDTERFLRLCLKMAASDWEEARAGIVLFDRGIIDAALALEREGFASDAQAALENYRYDTVVLAAPWPALFGQDDERRHGLAEAEREYHYIAKRLPELGYTAVALPEASVDARADWLTKQFSR